MRMTAQYTEVLYNLLNDSQVKPLIDKAMSTYPLYESTSKEEWIPSIVPTREELNSKILNYYKYREIGFETVGRFLDELEISLNEIMPRYNQLMFSADQDYNIIYNVDYKRTIDRDTTGESETETTGHETGRTTENGTSQGSEVINTNTDTTTTDATNTTSEDSTTTHTEIENNSKYVKSDTPQSALNISNKNIDSVSYASEAGWNKSNDESDGTTSGTGTTETTANGTSETTGESTSTTTGSTTGTGTSESNNTINQTGTNEGHETTLETTFVNYGVVSAQDLVMKYRELIINIEQMIINDPRIVELFMNVY